MLCLAANILIFSGIDSASARTIPEKQILLLAENQEENIAEITASSTPRERSADAPARNYLFIHDTSKNMRRKKRIPMMQTTIRAVLDALPRSSRAGLRAFGHRFSLDGPDFCSDTENIIPLESINSNREDFEIQLNLLSAPELGGGAPVGRSIREGIKDLRSYPEPKELFTYLVDLQECPDDRPLDAIQSACDVPDLHLTLIGIGLKRDFRTLQEAQIERLGCVDVINVKTPEQAAMLPDQLLTRFSVQFKNAEGQRVDPAPGKQILLSLFQQNRKGTLRPIREKIKNSAVKGTSIDTLGLDEGEYVWELSYEGQSIRAQQKIFITNRAETREVIQLGRMIVDVTDFAGNPLKDSIADTLTVTLTDAGQTIRTTKEQPHSEFDLLPGSQYNVLVSYHIGGHPQTLQYQQTITIEEGNHQYVPVALPVGSISGRILNMKGSPTSGVEMTLTGLSGGEMREQTVLTDQNGQYFFADLQNGEYTLAFQKTGYKREENRIMVVGGTIQNLEEMRLFRGIEVSVSSVSGTELDDATVSITHKASGREIPLSYVQHVYRNDQEIQDGEYLISVKRANYQAGSQTVTFQQSATLTEASFTLPYYITVSGHVLDGKKERVADATLDFHGRHSIPQLLDEQLIHTNSDGTFQATLLVSETGTEQIDVLWRDQYNQTFQHTLSFSLPAIPQDVDLGEVNLPINFLSISLHDLLGKPISADSILISHQQSGQSGIQMNSTEVGEYTSVALPDGDYHVRIIKKGYQEAVHHIAVRGGQVTTLPITLHNYITVTGIVLDGKNNRIPDAVITFLQQNSQLTSLQPTVTGKDGRFQATLLVKTPKEDEIEITWKSPDAKKEFRISRVFKLPGTAFGEWAPMDMGTYQLPANFIHVEIQDVQGRGLPGAEVQFISQHGEITRGIELGNGVYESLDLYDGYYNITLRKDGYKENVVISDVVVGKDKREVDAGKITLPHYATITGTILNGKDEGVPNVELFFGGRVSEQLERCRTDYAGRFSTTLLVTSAGTETWQAIWSHDVFQQAGVLSLPTDPRKTLNLGEIYLPINFVSIPIKDIQGKILAGVTVDIRLKDGKKPDLEAFAIEEIEPGTYEAQNLPDGEYAFTFEKKGYERDKVIAVTVKGGMHAQIKPVQLGHYVRVTGKAVDGKLAPVANATISFKELHSTVLTAEKRKESIAKEQEDASSSEAEKRSILLTDADGNFSATLLVTSPGIEQIIATWAEKYAAPYRLDLSEGPGTQHIILKLPINFVTVQVEDISGQPLSGVSITLEYQLEEAEYSFQEQGNGVYYSGDVPDGSYTVRVQKKGYESSYAAISVQTGEVQTLHIRLNHYVMIKGHVLNGKHEGLSAAVVTLANAKTRVDDKIISGTDGVFEARVLVKEFGKESGTISWEGSHGICTKPIWIDLPSTPQEIELTEQQTILPINYLTIEVKSVAATGIAGATVQLTHRESGKVFEARDNGNGNYLGEELPDGTYDIVVTKDKYQSVTLSDIRLEGGEHRRDLLVTNFSHYITLSGVVVNGKEQGVPNARVMLKDPKRIQDSEPFLTREDGSFTLHALVTDVGSETIEVVWNDTYSTLLSVELPLVPQDVQLDDIKLPINFAAVRVQDIYGRAIQDAAVFFVTKTQAMTFEENNSSPMIHDMTAVYTGKEVSDGVYESPELPDNDYLLLVKKEGYIQKNFPDVRVQGGENAPALKLRLPHLVTIHGRVINGKGEGVPGAVAMIDEQSTQKSRYYLETDDAGYFSERLQVTENGKELLTLSKYDHTWRGQETFALLHPFTPLKEPGEQEFANLRLPINFIPIQVQDVAGQAIDSASVTLRLSSDARRQQNEGDAIAAVNLGDGSYEGSNLKDGTYIISVEKEGYETQSVIVSVSAGENASPVEFHLPYYVVVEGIVTQGKGDGVSNALLEFDTEHSQIVPLDSFKAPLATPLNILQGPVRSITTDIDGHFITKLLVKKADIQHVKATWNNVYVKEYTFPLPEKPDLSYELAEEIRLPMNFAPFRISNVLGQGLSGVKIQLRQKGDHSKNFLLASPLGDGYYEAQELSDGDYLITIHKDGYQDITGEFSVSGGTQMSEAIFALPHYVTIEGVVVNGDGVGVEGVDVHLAGFNSQLVQPEAPMMTVADGSFQMKVLVTGSDMNTLQERLDFSWENGEAGQTIPFNISHDFTLPALPRTINLGLLTLPSNFFPVIVNDVSNTGLSGVSVSFIHENGQIFPAKEFVGGRYEGQNLPDGTYSIVVTKEGYQRAQLSDVSITSQAETSTPPSLNPFVFKLPYYIAIQGTTVDGKGQELSSDITVSLAGNSCQLLPESVKFDQHGHFTARLLVTRKGREQLQLKWQGPDERHSLQVPFVVPEAPQTIDFQRLSLPVNFIPIEVKDLNGYGVTGATVKLFHIENERELTAQELGGGQYEGQNLLDGSYNISVTKEGYKPSEHIMATVSGGVVSEIRSFRLRHYVWVTGIATNGNGEGVSDPVIEMGEKRSLTRSKRSDISGKFKIQLEVKEVGNEQMLIRWHNIYRFLLNFKLPDKPETRDIGEIRLPINFLSIQVSDISGSTLPDVNVSIQERSSGARQILKTDQNGFCKTEELANGNYEITVRKAGYQRAQQTFSLRKGQSKHARFTLAHYVIVRGQVTDVMQNVVGGAEVVFEEFFDAHHQKIRTATHPETGKFEKKLLINDTAFLERQKGHFLIRKGDLQQFFTFKIPAIPNQTIDYKTLLFPINYFHGKVVETEIRTVPISGAKISLQPIEDRLFGEPRTTSLLQTIQLETDSLGEFEARNIPQGEYRMTIEKDGYAVYEDFIRISGLLQKQEFTLRKKMSHDH